MMIRSGLFCDGYEGVRGDDTFFRVAPSNQRFGVDLFDHGLSVDDFAHCHNGLHINKELFVDFLDGLLFQSFNYAVLKLHLLDNVISHMVGEKDIPAVVFLRIGESDIGIVQEAALAGAVFREKRHTDKAADNDVISRKKYEVWISAGRSLRSAGSGSPGPPVFNTKYELIIPGVIYGGGLTDDLLQTGADLVNDPFTHRRFKRF